jgi:paraquat-inducible protein A
MKAAYWWPVWAVVNLAAFAGGALLPLVRVNQLYFFNQDIVLVQVPTVLARNGEMTLAAIVFLFGILLPVLKTLVYVVAPYSPRLAIAAGAFAPVAFFDIFMVALLIFVAKGGFASDAATAVGMYPLLFFAFSSKAIEWAFARAVRGA